MSWFRPLLRLTLMTTWLCETAHGCEGIKPGWVRINFNYFISEPIFSYLVEAVRLVAREGSPTTTAVP